MLIFTQLQDMCQKNKAMPENDIVGSVTLHKESHTLLFVTHDHPQQQNEKYSLICPKISFYKATQYFTFLGDVGVLPAKTARPTCNDNTLIQLWLEFKNLGNAPEVNALRKNYLKKVVNLVSNGIRNAVSKLPLRFSFYR